MDSFFAKQVKTGEIVRAQDVRDILGKIASDEGKSSTHIMQDYIKGDIDLEEAHARFEATGRSGDNYEKVKKFQRLISEKDFCDELKKEAVGNSKDILFSLRKINTAVTQLMKEIDTYEPYVSISDSIKRIDKEFGPKRDLLLMDNNVLRSPKFDQIIDEIKALGFEKGATFVNPKTGKTVVRHVDFNQGLDAFLLNEHKAQRLGELAIKPARIAFDHIEDEDVYVRAITLCARAGIDHMSNYLLYNGEDFTGKGHSYHADTPEDLFYRMHLTMELGENLTEELGRKIAIFSFPMRYIPLDNDQRGFIGANWNAKYLRALQCMLIPTQGKGIQGRSFFEADFGKTAEDFVMYLAMPERLLNKRGHFVERKDEPKFEREIRYTQWSENRHLIDTWMKYYSISRWDNCTEIS